jgi:predicted MPP superfamily phosphohydrolase
LVSLAFTGLAGLSLTAVILAMAWAGAVAWPIAAGAAAWALPWARRALIARLFALAMTVAWALGIWAFFVEPRMLVLRELEVSTPAWTGPPLRIGIISDVHVGPNMSPERVERLVARMNAETPDIVLLAGDYISGHLPPDARSDRENAELRRGLAALGRLEAPLGTVAVLGNHDWWYDGPAVEDALVAEGVAVLENEAVRVDRGDGTEFWLAGLADYDSERAIPDWRTSLGRVPAGADVLALGHWPDIFWGAPDRVALTVAGHSHCGQVNLPVVGRLVSVSPGSAEWPCGLYEEAGRRLYVTGGVGVSVLPVRFRAPPEMAIVTLEGAN